MSIENLFNYAAETKTSDTNDVPETDKSNIESQKNPAETYTPDSETLSSYQQDVPFDPDSRIDVSNSALNIDVSSQSFDPDARIEVPETEQNIIDNASETTAVQQDTQDVTPPAEIESVDVPASDSVLDNGDNLIQNPEKPYDENKTSVDDLFVRKNNEVANDNKAEKASENGEVKGREKQEVLSDVDLFTNPEDRKNQASGSKGEWSGDVGKSNFVPDRQDARDVLKKAGVESIRYDDNYEPDFSKVAKETVEIDNMTEIRRGDHHNFNQAYKKISEKWNAEAKDGKTDWEPSDVKRWQVSNELIPHERMDRKTMDFVPRSIHEACKHYGGCSECKERDRNQGGRFDD